MHVRSALGRGSASLSTALGRIRFGCRPPLARQLGDRLGAELVQTVLQRAHCVVYGWSEGRTLFPIHDLRRGGDVDLTTVELNHLTEVIAQDIHLALELSGQVDGVESVDEALRRILLDGIGGLRPVQGAGWRVRWRRRARRLTLGATGCAGRSGRRNRLRNGCEAGLLIRRSGERVLAMRADSSDEHGELHWISVISSSVEFPLVSQFVVDAELG
jgi:hypothetical protein